MMTAEQEKNMQIIPVLQGWEIGLDVVPDWVRALRETAAQSLITTGLPTPAWEDWKYTSLRALETMNFCTVPSLQTVPEVNSPFFALKPIVLHLLNGQLMTDISDLPDGLEIASLQDVLHEDWVKEHLAVPGNFATTPMEALNAAFLDDGITIRVRENVQIDRPVLLLFQHQNNKNTLVIMPRVLIVLQKNAKLNIIEHHFGQGNYLNNQVTTISINEAAELGHYTWQDEDPENGYSFNTTRLNCFDRGTYNAVTFTTGAKLSRHEIFTDLLGEQIKCILKGAYCLSGNQHHDTTIKTGHFEPRSTSKQIYKGVINDQARAVFQGKIHVHRHAQGTDGHQLNHALLLSEKAEINAKPELEIYADDVKCAHGATSGYLDDAALFYLRSRGVAEIQAKELLIKGFISEILNDISHADIRKTFLDIVARGDK